MTVWSLGAGGTAGVASNPSVAASPSRQIGSSIPGLAAIVNRPPARDTARTPAVDIEPLFGMILAQGTDGFRDSTPDPT